MPIAENAGTSTLTVSTGAGSTFEAAQTIVLSLAGAGTATEGSAFDFTILSKTLTLPPGRGTTPSSITTIVTAVQDKIDEPNETILIDAAIGGDTVGSQLTVTIDDDDAAPVLEFGASSSTPIAENAGTSTLTVSTGAGSTFEAAQTIVLSLAGAGTATEGSAFDFTILSKTLTLPAGRGTTPSSITTTVTAVQDKIDEPNETILIDAAIGGDTVGSQLTVTIEDNDAAPVLSLEVSEPTVVEARGTSIVTVSTGAGSTFETDQVPDADARRHRHGERRLHDRRHRTDAAGGHGHGGLGDHHADHRGGRQLL